MTKSFIPGFQGQPLVLHGSDGNDILLQLAKFDSDTEEGPVPQLRVSPDGITVSDVEDVRLIHPDTGEILFDFGHPELSVEVSQDDLKMCLSSAHETTFRVQSKIWRPWRWF